MRKILVIHKPAGYEGHKDQMPIRKPNIKAIITIFGGIFACGMVSAVCGFFFILPRFSPSELPSEVPTLALIETTPELTESALVVIVSSPMPTLSPTSTTTSTNTPSPTPSATYTPSLVPTLDLLSALALLENARRVEITAEAIDPSLQLTVEFLDRRLQEMETSRTLTPGAYNANAGTAIVSVDVALIRFLPGVGHRPMKAVRLGTELRLTGESRDGWHAVFYEGGIGWIWGELIRIERGQ